MANTRYLLDNLGEATISVVVGDDDLQKRFTLHENLVCTRSAFFRRCINGKWKEADDRVVILPEDYPNIFELYVQSLYAGNVARSKEIESNPAYYILLGDTFALAQKLLDVQAKNMVIRAIFDKIKDSVHPLGCYPCVELSTMMETIWEAAPVGSPVRRLVVDIFVLYSMEMYKNPKEESSKLAECLKNLPAELLVDLSVGLLKRRCVHGYMDRKFELENYLEQEFSEDFTDRPVP